MKSINFALVFRDQNGWCVFFAASSYLDGFQLRYHPCTILKGLAMFRNTMWHSDVRSRDESYQILSCCESSLLDRVLVELYATSFSYREFFDISGGGYYFLFPINVVVLYIYSIYYLLIVGSVTQILFGTGTYISQCSYRTTFLPSERE